MKVFRVKSNIYLLSFSSIATILIFGIGLMRIGNSIAHAQSNRVGAILYEHSHYQGRSVTVWAGGQIADLDGFNDKTSSMIIGRGCSVILYEHINFQGREMLLYGSYDGETRLFTVGGFNDKLSSLKTLCS
jgi:hypothetical protein